MVLIFDLPVMTKPQRKAATKFRLWLLDEGWEMSQFSVYWRGCVGKEQVDARLLATARQVPKDGKVHVLSMTDKQFESERLCPQLCHTCNASLAAEPSERYGACHQRNGAGAWYPRGGGGFLDRLHSPGGYDESEILCYSYQQFAPIGAGAGQVRCRTNVGRCGMELGNRGLRETRGLEGVCLHRPDAAPDDV